MIKIISKTGALKVFYYLMSADGATEFEMTRFDNIGDEFLGSDFQNIKEDLIAECESHFSNAEIEDLRYDLVQEGIDASLNETAESIDVGVVPRLLIWDMLTLAFSDDQFSANEDRLIAHVARILKIEKSVLVEMKQMISTAESVQKEKDLLENSGRPYSEIRPLVEEMEKRKQTIVEAVTSLIADDVTLEQSTPDPEKAKGNTLFNTGKMLGDAVASGSKQLGAKAASGGKQLAIKASPIGKELGKKAAPIGKEIGKRALAGGKDLGAGAGSFLSKIKGAASKPSVTPSDKKDS